MIQPLRVVHRRAFFALAAILPVIIAAGLSARRNLVSFSPALRSTLPEATRISPASVVWNKNSFKSEVFLNPPHFDAVTLILIPAHELSDPDLLLYWADQDVSSAAGLSDASLLGPFTAGKPFLLPRHKQHGALILYSLAHSEIVNKATVERLP